MEGVGLLPSIRTSLGVAGSTWQEEELSETGAGGLVVELTSGRRNAGTAAPCG